jgi:hypothetical protein
LVFAYAIGPGHDWNLPGAPFLISAVLVFFGAITAWRATRTG